MLIVGMESLKGKNEINDWVWRTLCFPLILPWFPSFLSPIDLLLHVFVPIVFPEVPFLDFVCLLFPIYSRSFGCFLH